MLKFVCRAARAVLEKEKAGLRNNPYQITKKFVKVSLRDSLLSIGILLILAAIIHNLLGYLLGYWGCRLLKMKEQDCRTIALEVGMQNGGLASGIALEMGKVSTIGLAPAVFGPWMNISGSSLATWWRDKDLKRKNKD